MRQVWIASDKTVCDTEQECREYEIKYYSKRKAWIRKLYKALNTLDEWCTECQCVGCPIQNELCDKISFGIGWTNCLDETARETIENEVENK